jgi:Leucine Rich repeat
MWHPARQIQLSSSSNTTDSVADSTEVRHRSRQVVQSRALLLTIGLLLVLAYIFVLVPFQRFTWIVTAVENNGGFSNRIERVHGGPDWLRKIVGDEWMYGFDRITRLTMTVNEPFETERLIDSLASQVSLKALTLASNDNCDDEFGHLAALATLEHLDLRGEVLSDEGMKCLESCRTLKDLRLSEMNITDDGVARLAALPSLQILSIADCPGVTNASVAHISGIQSLQELTLSGPGISGASIDALSEMTNLRKLQLMRTSITEAELLQLHEALPECHIHWYSNDRMLSTHLDSALH